MSESGVRPKSGRWAGRKYVSPHVLKRIRKEVIRIASEPCRRNPAATNKDLGDIHQINLSADDVDYWRKRIKTWLTEESIDFRMVNDRRDFHLCESGNMIVCYVEGRTFDGRPPFAIAVDEKGRFPEIYK